MKFLDLIKNKLSKIPAMWFLITIVASWSVLIQDGAINRDGLGYLEQATYFIKGEWKEGFLFYPWPFFGFLLASCYSFTHLPLQILAHLICLILFGISAYFFLKILQLIIDDKFSIFYGGLILICSISLMDDYVGMILRDHGLWAACMAGTFFYIRDQKNPSFRNSLKWQISFFIGGFFRPESFVFLMLLPLWAFITSNKKKASIFLINYSFLILIIIIFFLSIFFSDTALELLNNSRLTELIDRPLKIIERLFSPLPIMSEDLSLKILIDSHMFLISLVTMLSIIFIKWLHVAGGFNSFIFFYGLFAKKININYEIYKNILFFLIISFMIVFVNTYYVYVLSNRYWGFHLWWLYLMVVPIFIKIIHDKKTTNKIKFLLWGALFICFMNVMIDNPDNLEMDVAKYVNKYVTGSVDFGNFERISYYLNHDPFSYKNYHNSTNHKYKLIKTDQFHDDFKVKKKFPDNKPKFILIYND